VRVAGMRNASRRRLGGGVGLPIGLRASVQAGIWKAKLLGLACDVCLGGGLGGRGEGPGGCVGLEGGKLGGGGG
jgi:hypothetical protein